jgi:hypothetical protein
MSVPSEVTYLDADGVGVSPVAGYPGTITFPVVMTLAMHKEWQARVNARGEEASDAPRIGIAFNQAAEESERLAFLYDDVVLGLHFGKLAVTGPGKKKLTEKTPEAELPLPVAVWVAKAYREWENSQLLFRWDRNAGVAVSNGAE